MEIEIGDVAPANLQQVRLINTSTLPVRYSDKFYNELLSNVLPQYLKFAIYNGFTIGTVCARVEDVEGSSNKKLYIMILNVLPAYRRRGVASKLLEHVLSTAMKDKAISEVYLHVQTSNEDAIAFYKSKGFSQTAQIDNYYKRIDPPHAYVLHMALNR